MTDGFRGIHEANCLPLPTLLEFTHPISDPAEGIPVLIITRAFLFALTMVVSVAAFAQERRPGTPGDETGRDAVGFRKDKVTNETVGERRPSANTPTTKQAIEDFLEIQKINQQIQQMSREQPLTLDKIASAAKQVSTRASRLRTSLSLPAPPKETAKTEAPGRATTDQLLEQIKELDVNIKAFATNPIFRQMNDSTKDLPMEASINLKKVIGLSKWLEEQASKLKR
jgi:hypothetical protein